MGTAFLSVGGNVSGANVLVDNLKVGNTPLSNVVIEAGRHRVLVKKPGYETFQKTIQIKRGRSLSLYVDLTKMAPQKESLYVDTDPCECPCSDHEYKSYLLSGYRA
ncbi:MAG: PEGA domain-containing protein [Deltaproteobacteria bacterium]|nr:PEGA domain-containing protein [Deltaproteobacteria bacterium]